MHASVSSLKVVPNAEVGFRPIDSTLAPVPPSPVAQSEAASKAAPTVSFQRDGGRITRVSIVCSCGEQIDLACDYSQEPG